VNHFNTPAFVIAVSLVAVFWVVMSLNEPKRSRVGYLHNADPIQLLQKFGTSEQEKNLERWMASLPKQKTDITDSSALEILRNLNSDEYLQLLTLNGYKLISNDDSYVFVVYNCAGEPVGAFENTNHNWLLSSVAIH
jgi:hypothetical protein